MDEFDLTRRLFAEPATDPEAKQRARARLEALTRPRPERVPWRRAGVVAAALVGVLVLQVVLPPGDSGPASSAAAELRRLGTVAARHELGRGGGPIAYSRYREYAAIEGEDLGGGATFVAFVLREVEAWRAPDGGGRWVQVVSRIDYPSARDRIRWRQVGGPPVPGPGGSLTEDFEPGAAEFEDLGLLPRDPESLLDAIRDDPSTEPDDDLGVLVRIGSLLGRGDADPGLRAALFRAAALLPGVELGGEVKDRLGRLGEEITIRTEGVVVRLIVEPDSSLLLGYETVASGGPSRGIASWRAYTAWSRVGTIGERWRAQPTTG
jgi:hypothetical protein